MTLSPKTLLTLTATSILMAGASFASAQETAQEAPAPEVVETIEAPKVESLVTESIQDMTVEGEAITEPKNKIVEEVDATMEAKKIDASSKATLPTEETAPEAEDAADEIVEPNN